MADRIFIIAEAGVNHGGNVGTAKKMIDAARRAGADAVKFQTFKSEDIAGRYAPKAAYQKKTGGRNERQLKMLRRLELDAGAHKELIEHCRKKGIIFLSAPFDLESIDLLDDLGLDIFKIPSGEITNLPYLRKIGGLKKKLILSTGMADLREIKEALEILAVSGTPRGDITVLHCTTEYPAPMDETNLRAIGTIRAALGVKVGYSDHTMGIEASIAASALGASIIEKHFTLSRKMRGPDHAASLEPDELKAMVDAIRNIGSALGNGIKRPAPSELKNKAVVRKSIVAARDINKGEIFAAENIAVKRPAAGISPMKWDTVIGRIAAREFKRDEAIEL